MSPVAVQFAGQAATGVADRGTGVVAGVEAADGEGEGVATVAVVGVAGGADDDGTDDGSAPVVQATRIRVSAVVAATRRIEAGIGGPPDGLLP